MTCLPYKPLLLNKSRRINWVGHVLEVEVSRNSYKCAVRKSGRRLRRRCEDNIKMDVKE